MHSGSAKFSAALILIALTLAACATRSERPVSTTLDQDDDTFCRANNVAAGSSEYIACRKDRDVQRNNANARADRRQRDLGEDMLNHPNIPNNNSR